MSLLLLISKENDVNIVGEFSFLKKLKHQNISIAS